MDVITLTRGPWRTNAYLVSDGTSGEAVLIDPVEDGEQFVDEAERRGWRIAAIVSTHSHIDHTGGVAGARARCDAPFMIGAEAEVSLRQEPQHTPAGTSPAPLPPPTDRLLREGDIVRAGSLAFRVLDTPGHSRGDIALYEPHHRAVFSGDTIGRGFINAVNPGCDVPRLIASIKSKLLTLPDETTAYPGHGPSTTIGHERATNPALQDSAN